MPRGIYLHQGYSEGTRRKISRAITGIKNPFYGKHHTEEAKEKNRLAHLGKSAWNKGTKGLVKAWNKGRKTGKFLNCLICGKQYRVVLSKVNSRKYCSPECAIKAQTGICGKDHYMYGRHLSVAQKQKISEGNKGKKLSQKTKDKIGKANKGNKPWTTGKHLPEGTRKKISKALKNSKIFKAAMEKVRLKRNYKPTKETIRKCLTRRIPSSLEEKFLKIAEKCNLPYKYVGNGSFIIENCNPDFINTDGQKIAVEVYATYYKKRNHTDIEQWKVQRQNIFRKYGWLVLFFSEAEVTEENVLMALNSANTPDESVV